ncbi:hypothetical protein LCGC14_2701550, partial [marine sediment metagenome]
MSLHMMKAGRSAPAKAFTLPPEPAVLSTVNLYVCEAAVGTNSQSIVNPFCPIPPVMDIQY